MGKKRSNKGKGSYLTYKTENRVYKNKVSKLERHLKKYPKDVEAQTSLARIKKEGYKGRTKPLVPGSNQTISKHSIPGYIHYPETAGEQLARLLGIKLPVPSVKSKPKISVRKKRNVGNS